MKFSGVMTAIVTPMTDGAVDEAALRGLVRAQLEGGVSGIVACGSTGEAATLTASEQSGVVRVVVDEVSGRVPVIAGVGARSTHGAVAEAKRGAEAGADALLVVTPAYNKPTQAGLEAHFQAVTEASSLPVCLYNVPGRTGVDLLPETVARLAQHPRIVAIKEATGSMPRAAAIQRLVEDDFSLMSGDDFTVLPFVAQGGHGCISVVSNILPSPMVELVRCTAEGKSARAQELHLGLLPVSEAMFTESNPIPVKTAAAWMGLIPTSELRLPLTPLTEGAADQVEQALLDIGVRPERTPGVPSTLGPGVLPDPAASEARTIEYNSPMDPSS